MRKLTLVLSVAALGLAGAASAQQAAAPAKAPPADMTRAQAQARATAAFDRMDANRDGTINAADREARRAQMFDRIDTDRNGSISREEFAAMHAKRGGGERADGAKRDGMRGGKHGEGRHAMMMKRMGDTPMTRQAFVDHMMTMFDRADANRDGTVTAAERKTMRETMRSQWKARAAQRQQG